jgi:hypothetical protein
MTWIYVWTSEPKSIYVWTTPVKEVYVWTTKVRPKPMSAWIFHNATLWLISLSSDGSNWLTIADKNLWATTVYNSGDTLSEANCGKFYQWGNNYWFPFTWPTTTSSTQVNAQNYWPWNYYSSSTYIYGLMGNGWDSSNNSNLRWSTTDTYVARRWPCDFWYHIPSYTERNNLISVCTTIWAFSLSSTDYSVLKIPFSWYCDEADTSILFRNSRTAYWSSDISSSDSGRWVRFTNSNQGTFASNSNKSSGRNIRPFKNEAVQPDSSRTKLY